MKHQSSDQAYTLCLRCSRKVGQQTWSELLPDLSDSLALPTVIHGSGKQAFPGSATELLMSTGVNSRHSIGNSVCVLNPVHCQLYMARGAGSYCLCQDVLPLCLALTSMLKYLHYLKNAVAIHSPDTSSVVFSPPFDK